MVSTSNFHRILQNCHSGTEDPSGLKLRLDSNRDAGSSPLCRNFTNSELHLEPCLVFSAASPSSPAPTPTSGATPSFLPSTPRASARTLCTASPPRGVSPSALILSPTADTAAIPSTRMTSRQGPQAGTSADEQLTFAGCWDFRGRRLQLKRCWRLAGGLWRRGIMGREL